MVRTKQENGTWFAFDNKGIMGFSSTEEMAMMDYLEQSKALMNQKEYQTRW